MSFPNPPVKIVPFGGAKVEPYDIGRQFDEHARSIKDVIDFLRTLIRDDGQLRQLAEIQAKTAIPRNAPLATGVLGPNVGGPFGVDPQGASATAQDWSQVSIEWAEHMPDTIPPNILATNAITGDHWSSRWWANRAAQLVSSIGVAGSIYPNGVFAEALTVTGSNTLSPLTKDPAGPVLLIVNQSAFLPVGSPPPFTVIGRIITWGSTVYGLQPTDVAAVWYPVAATVQPAPPLPAGIATVLYYIGVAGKTTFPLAASDYYGNAFGAPVGTLRVTRNGLRLMPDLGAGVGGFTFASNTVTLTMPTGDGEVLIIDVWGT
jgi:hypothetical protein